MIEYYLDYKEAKQPLTNKSGTKAPNIAFTPLEQTLMLFQLYSQKQLRQK